MAAMVMRDTLIRIALRLVRVPFAVDLTRTFDAGLSC